MQKFVAAVLIAAVSTTLLAGAGCNGVQASEKGLSGGKLNGGIKGAGAPGVVCSKIAPGFSDGLSGGWVAGGGNALAGTDGEAAMPACAPVPKMVAKSTPQPARLMTFEANVSLCVPDIRSATDQILALIKNNGGYLQQQSDTYLLVKVPASSLEKTLADLEKIGRIINKNLRAEDVTDTMFDINTRIDNLENLRRRLLVLIEKAAKVEDMIKIEKELARITQELELLKGRKRNMEDRITFSTLTINLSSELPQQQVQRMIPVSWVKDLGGNITNQNYCNSTRSGSYRPFNYPLPDGFAIINYDADIKNTVAASSDGLILEMSIAEGLKDAKTEFWHNLIRRALEEVNAYKIVSDTEFKNAGELPGFKIEASKKVGNKTYTYMVAVMVDVNSQQLYFVECWGETELFSQIRKNMEASLPQMQPWRWWQSAY